MMTRERTASISPWQYGERRVTEIWENLTMNNLNLSKRMLKNVACTTAVSTQLVSCIDLAMGFLSNLK